MKKNKLLKCIFVCIFVMPFMALHVSKAVAQWPSYTGSLFSESINSDFFFMLGARTLENYNNDYINGLNYNYYSNSFFTPYLENYNNDDYDNHSYVRISNLYSYTGTNNFPSLIGNYNESILGIGTMYYSPDLFVHTPTGAMIPSFPGYTPPGALWGFSPPTFPFQFANSTIPVSNYYSNEQGSPNPPRSAPENMKGEWQSEELTGEDDGIIKGDLEYDQNENYLNMLGSSLALGNGELIQFTRISKIIPVIIKDIGSPFLFTLKFLSKVDGLVKSRFQNKCKLGNICWLDYRFS